MSVLTIPPALAKQMFVAREEMTASFNKQLGTEDWVYRDIPWLRNEQWDEFLGIIGDGNHKMLVGSSDGLRKRGQLMVSPDGMDRIRARAALPTPKSIDPHKAGE